MFGPTFHFGVVGIGFIAQAVYLFGKQVITPFTTIEIGFRENAVEFQCIVFTGQDQRNFNDLFIAHTVINYTNTCDTGQLFCLRKTVIGLLSFGKRVISLNHRAHR